MFGAEFRRVESRVHRGKTALVIVAIRSYDTTVEDLSEAITTPARIARWFKAARPTEPGVRLRIHARDGVSPCSTLCDRDALRRLRHCVFSAAASDADDETDELRPRLDGWLGGSMVVARGNPFWNSVDDVEQALDRLLRANEKKEVSSRRSG